MLIVGAAQVLCHDLNRVTRTGVVVLVVPWRQLHDQQLRPYTARAFILGITQACTSSPSLVEQSCSISAFNRCRTGLALVSET